MHFDSVVSNSVLPLLLVFLACSHLHLSPLLLSPPWSKFMTATASAMSADKLRNILARLKYNHYPHLALAPSFASLLEYVTLRGSDALHGSCLPSLSGAMLRDL
jgi:hypothetical protein